MYTWNAARNYARSALEAKLGRNPVFHPILTTFEITYRCNLGCTYCSDGSGVRCPDVVCEELETSECLDLFRVVRQENDMLGVTGGEPLLRDDIVEVLRGARRLGFQIVLNTNAVLFDEKPEILDHAWEVITSLDCLDLDLFAALSGCSRAVAERAIRNMEAMAVLQRKKRFGLTIQAVINEQTLSHTREVMRFCREHEIVFSPSPEIRGTSLQPDLARNDGFLDLMAEIRRRKACGEKILTTLDFLDTVIEGRPFRCMPMVNPRIRPNGDLFYPCFPLKKIAGNLLREADYRKVIRMGIEKHGPPPECEGRCQFNCVIDFARIVQKPSIILQELALKLRGLGVNQNTSPSWRRVKKRGTGSTSTPSKR